MTSNLSSFIKSIPVPEKENDSLSIPMDSQNTTIGNTQKLLIQDKYSYKLDLSGLHQGVIVKVITNPKLFEYSSKNELENFNQDSKKPIRYKVYVQGPAGSCYPVPSDFNSSTVELLDDYSLTNEIQKQLSNGQLVFVDIKTKIIHSINDQACYNQPVSSDTTTPSVAFNNPAPVPQTVGSQTPTPVDQNIPPNLPLDEKKKIIINLVIKALIGVGIKNINFIAAFLANIEKETNFVIRSEFSYSKTPISRLREIFTSRLAKLSDDELEKLKKDDIAFYDLIYGKDGPLAKTFENYEKGDGFNFRGRGFIQFTGKNLYRNASLAIYKDLRLVENPDLVNNYDVAANFTAYYVKLRLPVAIKQTKIKLDENLTEDNACILTTSLVGGSDVRQLADVLKKPIWVKILGKVRSFFPKYVSIVKEELAKQNV